MLEGYTGKILLVDLTTREIGYRQIDESSARKYIGGIGIAANILWDETDCNTDPFSPQNPLIFMTGPLSGSDAPKSSRCILAGISPLTGIWGQSHCGGSLADEIRHAGFDGIVIKGQSEKPVYIWLHNEQVEFRDAGHLWGMDTYAVADILRKETDKNACPASIGRAGERLMRFSGIMSDGKQGRAAARCGLGALMGSKKLKALVVKGTLPLSFYDREKLKESASKIRSMYPAEKPENAIAAHMKVFQNFLVYGRMPVKNWSKGTFGPAHVYPDDMLNAIPMYCKRCHNGCSESYKTADGERHMVWEAWGPLGTNCLIANVGSQQQAYTFCNKYGIDAISAGAVMSFAMECYEKGLITKEDTGGVELTWGNHEAMLEMLRMIGEREGFGELLGEGIARAAKSIGGIASEYAMHVKGMEFPAHDPRSMSSLALGYATGSIGAAHMEVQGASRLENWLDEANPRTCPDLGFPTALTRFGTERKGELVAKTQDFGCLLDSLTICLFLSWEQWVQPSSYVELLSSATGWDMDLDEFLLVGERISNLKRMFNVRRGISRKDDILPARILTQKLEDGGAKGEIPELGLMLNEYYSYRGWSEEGIPTKDKLTQLDLQECISNLTV
ncbi:aldehyde ferredoxin oxidoreductase family protein [Chloroflexota bacterium]